MIKKKLTAALVILSMAALSGCGAPEDGREDTSGDTPDQTEESVSEDDFYHVKSIEMEESEEESAENLMNSFGALCAEIYENADKGSASNVVLEEENVHEMVEAAAAEGLTVTCGSYDYNMLNYENVDECLRKAAEGEAAEAEFYEITASGYFRYFSLGAEEGDLIVTYANAAFNDAMELQIRQLEKFQVYVWEYTEKGWLIWEKATSRNQEMDMHSFFRVLPLDEKCREFCSRYISPVSYFSNNLFLTDWDEGSMDQIEFNDLYDFLYAMKYGESLDEEQVQGGIPKEEFESVVQTYFDISAADLEVYAGYDSANGVYPWEAVDPWNRVRDLQPFPEVVRCEENPDGTVTLYVETILVEDGTDCSFRHTVTMRQMDDGRWVYAGNDVDEEGSASIPGYVPRREW